MRPLGGEPEWELLGAPGPWPGLPAQPRFGRRRVLGPSGTCRWNRAEGAGHGLEVVSSSPGLASLRQSRPSSAASWTAVLCLPWSESSQNIPEARGGSRVCRWSSSSGERSNHLLCSGDSAPLTLHTPRGRRDLWGGLQAERMSSSCCTALS